MSDSVKLGSVIQLSPHGETDKIDVLGTTEDEAALVSLDDSYEVNGSESIQIITRSALELFNRQRLDKKGMTALRITGTESFFPGYDKFNARKGGESFLTKLKDGFIAIVKAVAKWITDLVNWGMTRLKTLFGFAKTEKQIASAEKHLEVIKPIIHNLMVRSFGGSQAAGMFSIEEFMQSLPEGVTGKEAMVIIKNRAESNKVAVERLTKSEAKISEAIRLLDEATRKAKVVKSRYRRAVDNLSQLVRKGKVDAQDLVEFNQELADLAMEDLSFERYVNMTDELVDKLFGIKVSGLGTDGGFKFVSDAMKSNITQVKAAVNVEDLETYKNLKDTYLARVNSMELVQLNPETLKDLKDVVNTKDGDLVREVADLFPENQRILADYLDFAGRLRQYNEALVILGQVLQNATLTSSSIAKWITSIEAIGVAYVAGDIAKIIAAHEQASPGQSGMFMSDAGLPRMLPDDTRVLKHYYPGINITEEISDFSKAVRELPDVKKAVNNLMGELQIPFKV